MANNENHGVTSLQDLATDVFFKEIIYKATPRKVESIRDWTDQQLFGRVKKAFREKCVKKLNEIDFNLNTLPEDRENIHDFFAPLNCILDDNFVQLAILIPLPFGRFFSTLMSIIGHHCPSLKELDIGTKFDWAMALKSHQSPTIPNSNYLLNQLTSLTLKHLDFPGSAAGSQSLVNEENQSVLSIIGKCCPSLVTLKTEGCCIPTKDIFGLIVGEWADILLPADKKPSSWGSTAEIVANCYSVRGPSVSAGRQVPPEFLNPICFTLEELHLQNSCKTKCHCILSSMSKYDAAFGLRHLPKLRVAEFPDVAIAEVISCMHQVRGIQTHQAEFENFCKESATAHPNLTRYEFTSPSIVYSGSLPLEKVKVSVKDEDSLQAIGIMCPNLAHVCFVDTVSSPHFSQLSLSQNSMGFSGTQFAANMPPNRLQSIFREWPKPISITLLGVHQEFVKPILDVFGPTLKMLELDSLNKIKLSDMAPCSKLKELTIKLCHNFEASYPSNWTWANTLPHLKSIKSECCLGNWAPLIERKLSSLNAAQLSCCHIGTDGHNPRIEWSQLPELWPLLESLELQQCSGLTIDMVSTLIPQLGALKCVTLPRYLFQKDLERAANIHEYFTSKNNPVQIDVYNSAWAPPPCPFQRRSRAHAV